MGGVRTGESVTGYEDGMAVDTNSCWPVWGCGWGSLRMRYDAVGFYSQM